MLHICCHCTTVRDVCPSSSTSSSATLNHSAFTCQGLSINRAPACARQLPPGNNGSQHRYLSCAVSCVPLCDLPAQPAWPCARWGATLYSPTCCSFHRTFALGAVRFCMANGVDGGLHASLGTTTRRPPHTRALPLLYFYCKSVQISAHINTLCRAARQSAALLHSSNHAQQLRAAAN